MLIIRLVLLCISARKIIKTLKKLANDSINYEPDAFIYFNHLFNLVIKVSAIKCKDGTR